MLVSKVMDTTPAYCVPADTAEAVASIMKRNDIEFMPVVENEPTHMLVGVVTDRDLCLRVVGEGKSPAHTQVGDLMTAPGVRCRDEDDLRTAERIMRRCGVHHLPVLNDGGALVGVIALADVLRSGHSEASQEKPNIVPRTRARGPSQTNRRSRRFTGTNTGEPTESSFASQKHA